MNYTIIKTLPHHHYSIHAAAQTQVIDTQSGQSLCIVSASKQDSFFAIGYSVQIGDCSAIIHDISYTTSAFKPQHVEQRILALPPEARLFLEAGEIYDIGIVLGECIDLSALQIMHSETSCASTELWLRTSDHIPSLIWPKRAHWSNISRAPELAKNHFYCITIRSAQEILIMNISYSYPI